MTKSEKLFEILEHVSKDPNLTPKALAELCGVSKRAIYRYLNTLSKVGISIQFQDGGYKLKGSYGDILKKATPESLESVKLLLLAGMRVCEDNRLLEYGREFIKLIEMSIPTKRKVNEIEIVPEEIRAVHNGGMLTIGQGSRPDIINPILTSETISVTLMNLIFSGLVRFDEAQRPVPDLAKRWEMSEDGLVWTFFIREDIVFHDGHPLTAHDVEFTYKAIMDPQNMSPRVKRYGSIDSMEAEGDYIFRIFMKHPFVPLMSRLGWPIAPRHLLENADLHKTPFNRHPVGSGPFKLTEWGEDDTIILDANRKYFRKDRPILDRLIFKTYPDGRSALESISRGEMDITLNLAAPDILFVGKSGSFRVYPVSSPFHYALVFNLKDRLFRDIKVRKALDYAIDKESIVKDQLKEHGSICTGPFDINSWAYNPHVMATPYDVEKARELLSQSGWQDTNGDGILDRDGKLFEVSLGVLSISDMLTRIAEAVKKQLMRVGIRVNLIRIDDSELYKTPFQAIMTMIAAGSDPEYARRSWHSKSGKVNLASYENHFVDNLMDLGRQTRDPEARKAIYHKIHEMIHDDCPAVFLASALEYIGSNYRFRNNRFSSSMHFLNTMKDWQIVREEMAEAIYEEEEEEMTLSAE